MERKLASIVAGDIVGYTRLMAEDEAGTHAALRSAFGSLIVPTVERHGGRTFKVTGDGFLATFPSVNEALDAAIDIQDGFAEQPFQLRIGINLGDIIDDDGDMFGDGVNVAARLEAMANPGSIFVSEAVVRSADRRRHGLFYRVGQRRAKNIPEGLNVYAVRPNGGAAPAAWLPPRVVQSARRAIPFAAAALLLAAATQAPSLAALTSTLTNGVAWVAERRAGPTVVVLPFDTMSGEADQAYFADGLTEDITAALARNPDLQVIARNSAFAVREQASDVREVGRRLGAGYVVEGSARREGDQLRVVAQLIDARSGVRLWSQSYDRRVEDVFAVQTEVTAEIVGHLVSYVRQTEVANAVERPTADLQAYDLVLQARARYKSGSPDGDALLAARGLLQRALELDPTYAAARAHLGMTYIVDMAQSVTDRATMADLETGLSEARQAIRLDPDLAVGYQALSFGLSVGGAYADAIQMAERALALNPNDPDSLMTMAKAQVRFETYDEAVRNAERARRLHPLSPAYYTYVHGQALYAAGRLEEAASAINECLIREPRDPDCLLIRSAIQSARGDLPDARATMAQLLEVKPGFSLAAERDYRRFGNSALMDQFLATLERAEAPETTVRPATSPLGSPA